MQKIKEHAIFKQETLEKETNIWWNEVKDFLHFLDAIVSQREGLEYKPGYMFDNSLVNFLIHKNNISSNKRVEDYTEAEKNSVFRLERFEFYFSSSFQKLPQFKTLWGGGFSYGVIKKLKTDGGMKYSLSHQLHIGSFANSSWFTERYDYPYDKDVFDYYISEGESWRLNSPSENGPLYDEKGCQNITEKVFSHIVDAYGENYEKLIGLKIQRNAISDNQYAGHNIIRNPIIFSDINELDFLKKDIDAFSSFFERE